MQGQGPVSFPRAPRSERACLGQTDPHRGRPAARFLSPTGRRRPQWQTPWPGFLSGASPSRRTLCTQARGHYFLQVWERTVGNDPNHPDATRHGEDARPHRNPNMAAAQKFPRVAAQRTEGLGVPGTLWVTRQLPHKQASHKRQRPGVGAGVGPGPHPRRSVAGNAGFPARPLHSFGDPLNCILPSRALALHPSPHVLSWGGRHPEPRHGANTQLLAEKTVSGWCIEKGIW